MASINKVILLGNLGADPEIRYTAGGDAVATISVATSSSWNDKQSGDCLLYTSDAADEV